MAHLYHLLAAEKLEEPVLFDDFQVGMLAGLIIGEGTVTLSRAARGNFKPEVKLSSTDPRIISWVSNTLQRANVKHFVSQMNAKRLKKPTHKIQFSLAISGLTECYRFLSALRPYLFVKGEQADIVLAFIQLRVDAMRRHVGRFGNPPKVMEEDAMLVAKIRELNQRGVRC